MTIEKDRPTQAPSQGMPPLEPIKAGPRTTVSSILRSIVRLRSWNSQRSPSRLTCGATARCRSPTDRKNS